jgi:hypothetical protein
MEQQFVEIKTREEFVLIEISQSTSLSMAVWKDIVMKNSLCLMLQLLN